MLTVPDRDVDRNDRPVSLCLEDIAMTKALVLTLALSNVGTGHGDHHQDMVHASAQVAPTAQAPAKVMPAPQAPAKVAPAPQAQVAPAPQAPVKVAPAPQGW
jgi:hypothetical protein